jgi:O-antigen ligase
MQLFNQSFNSFNNVSKFLTLIFFGFLPISYIYGNSTINLNLILLNLLFLANCIHTNNWGWSKDNLFKSLLFLYFFLILNSAIAYYVGHNIQTEGIIRSLSFIKFILLVFAFKILISNYEMLRKIMKIWLIIILIFIFDIFFEKLIGNNILGYISPDGTRIVSFFKNELVVGGFVFCFGSAVASFYLSDHNTEKKLTTLFLLIIPIAVFITGERANFIKSTILFLLIIIFIDRYRLIISKKIILGIVLISITLLFNFSKNLTIKYTEFFNRINFVEKDEKIINKIQDIKYFAHWDTAIKIFKNYPILGIGNKNFRNECGKDKYHNKNLKFTGHRCSTHPHQIHFEILSEHGLIGYTIIIFILAKFLFNNFCYYKDKKEIFYFSNATYLLLFFTPLLPGGGVFSTFNGTFFWIIFSLTNLRYNKKELIK